MNEDSLLPPDYALRLTLHNEVFVDHLPYLPFPPNYPVYIPRDKIANWLEFYADTMELNVWTGTEFTRGACWFGAISA